PLSRVTPGGEATGVLPVPERGQPAPAQRSHARAPRPPFLGWMVAAMLILVLLIAAVIALDRGLSGNAPGLSPSSGGSPTTTSTSSSGQVMPPLLGQKRDDAERLLHSMGVSVGVVSVPGMHDVVVRTDPPAGSPLSPGSTVTLYVGMGKEHGNGNGHGGGGD